MNSKFELHKKAKIPQAGTCCVQDGQCNIHFDYTGDNMQIMDNNMI